MDAIEKDIANEIINICLSKAADSMAFFTKEKVIIRGLDIKEIDISEVTEISKKSKEMLYVLTTELKGELEGISYLIFTESEVEKLLDISFPASIHNDKEKLRVMGDALLLEMDNIIVASVITHFSNFFNYTMRGDVPRLTKSYSNELTEMIISENADKGYFMYIKSEIHAKDLDINPDFVWILDDNYSEGVKSIAKNDELLKKTNFK